MIENREHLTNPGQTTNWRNIQLFSFSLERICVYTIIIVEGVGILMNKANDNASEYDPVSMP